MLLHPAVEGDDVFESGVIQGHEVRFATVNLAASSPIRERLLSQEDDGDSPDRDLSRGAMGMLLHPAVEGDDVFESGVIQGHEVRFATVNLAASSRAIRERLLSVVSEEGAGSPLTGCT